LRIFISCQVIFKTSLFVNLNLKPKPMMKKLFLLMLTVAFLASCGPRTTQEERVEETYETELPADQRAFLDNLASLCGQSFRGQETYMAEGRDSWADKDFVMHVTVCEENRVHIPFHLSEDHSRTWMFLVEDGRLRFRHDHRYPDGTPEAQTLYGGYADGTGTPYRQSFPADEYSLELLDYPERERVWDIVLDEEMTNYSYRLLYRGEIVFQADFDLTNPL
jgi:hypothetical protein